jgi:hypothetical protein
MRRRTKINKGTVYNNWTFIEEWITSWKIRYVKVKCICWIIKEVQLSTLKNWTSLSCWCIWIVHKKHWMTWTRIYNIWTWILRRCNNINFKHYHRYGGRWIKCEWDSFKEFYEDMNEWYKEHLTIERRKNNWNYCKSNCCWATRKQQANNRSRRRTKSELNNL